MTPLALVIVVISWLVSLVVLYVVIRLAVTHAILATRPRDAAPAREQAPPPSAWWQQGDKS